MDEKMAQKLIEQQQELLKKNQEKTIPIEKEQNSSTNVYSDQKNEIKTEITSLGKSERWKEQQNQKIERLKQVEETQDSFGWIDMPLSALPTGGKFYPNSTRITYRSALNNEIRNYSMMDETDIIDIDDKLNMIVDKCCRIFFDNSRVTFKDLIEVDRFYIIYSIRDLTFPPEVKNVLQTSVQCTQCQNVDSVNIEKSRFQLFNMPYDLERFYNEEEKHFKMKVKNTGEDIDIYLPTLGVTNFIKYYIRKKRQSQQNLDTSFLSIAPFLFSDWKILNDISFNKMMQESLGWSLEKMSYIIKIIDKLKTAISPQLNHTCQTCGEEVSAPISFPNGIKNIFLYASGVEGDSFDGLV